MAKENTEQQQFDLGIVDTVIEDIPDPDKPIAIESVMEMVGSIKELRCTPPLKMVVERIEARKDHMSGDWTTMDLQDKACILVLFAFMNAKIRDDAKHLIEQAT